MKRIPSSYSLKYDITRVTTVDCHGSLSLPRIHIAVRFLHGADMSQGDNYGDQICHVGLEAGKVAAEVESAEPEDKPSQSATAV